MEEDIKAIDIMNYPNQCVRGLVDFSQFDEFQTMARGTFRTMFPSGRFPTEEELKSYPVGTQFNPYPSVEAMVEDMDKLGYDKICICACKMWSYRRHFKLLFDFSIDTVYEIVKKAKGRVIGAAGYNPFRIEESLRQIDKAVKEYGFKFVYFHPVTFGLSPNDKACWPLYAKCNELGVPVSIQVGQSAEPLPSWVGHPMELDEVAINFPNLKINLSHTGWPWIDEWYSMIWRYPYVYGDIAAYMPRSLEASTVRFMDSGRGRDKILFGTNGLGLKVCKEQFMGLKIRDDTKRKVLRENALLFLGLEE
jgi:hypothetical protein